MEAERNATEWSPMPAGVTWTSPPLCTFERSRHWMEARFGKPHWTDLDSNGVGLFDAWALRFECGHEVTLWLFHQLELGRECLPHELAPVEVHADDTERGHTCFHLGVERDWLSLWEPDAGYDGPLVWGVRRQDDNGNQYDIARFSSRCEAEAVARQLESRGHKQLYWVVAPAKTPTPPRAVPRKRRARPG